MAKYLFLFLMLLIVSGCAAGTKVIEPITQSSKIAIIEFADCGKITAGEQVANLGKSAVSDCVGSGKIASKIYSDIFAGAPVFSTENDPAVKNFDLLIAGKIVNYNIGTPFIGRVNYAEVDLVVKRINGKIIATQQDKNDASPTYGKKTPELVKEFAEELKKNLGI